jgi:hypothetical protein
VIRRWRDEVGDTTVLGLVRVMIGVLLFTQFLRAAEDLTKRGYFGDFFHMPFLPESLVASHGVYAALLGVALLASICAAVGLRPRAALLVSALIGLYFLLCDRVQFHHNRYALVCFAFLLSFAPCDRAYFITGGALPPSARAGGLWAQRLAQLQLSIIYVASGGSKLVDPDWRDGLVLYDRFVRYGHQALERGVPQSVVDFFSRPSMTSGLSRIAIATELTLAVALWFRRTRVVALWWGAMFHLTIEATSQVEIFTWLSLTIYGLFVTPDYKARKLHFDPTRARGRAIARFVRLCDWFSRFEIRPWEPDERRGHSIVVMRRDGARATGLRAAATIAQCVPLFFPLWAPIAFVASFTRGSDSPEP